jgi:hypothetical protein
MEFVAGYKRDCWHPLFEYETRVTHSAALKHTTHHYWCWSNVTELKHFKGNPRVRLYSIHEE